MGQIGAREPGWGGAKRREHGGGSVGGDVGQGDLGWAALSHVDFGHGGPSLVSLISRAAALMGDLPDFAGGAGRSVITSLLPGGDVRAFLGVM